MGRRHSIAKYKLPLNDDDHIAVQTQIIYIHMFNAYPERDTMGNDERGGINLDGVDRRSFSIKSRSVASELSNCKKIKKQISNIN